MFGAGGNKAFTPFTMTPGQGQQQAPQASAFSFGGAATAAPGATGTQFSFGSGLGATQPAQPTAAPQLSFTAATPAATTSSLFSFGGPAAATATVPAPGAGTTTGAAPVTQFSFGTAVSASAPGGTAAAPQLSFSTPAPAASSASLFSFGGGSAPAPTASVAPAQATSTAPAPAPATGTVSATPATQFSFGTGMAAASTAPQAPQVSFIAPTPAATTTSASILNFGVTPTAPTTSATPAAPTSATTSAPTIATVPALATATATTQANAAAGVSQMNFRQLQEAINKWMLDLQEQERIFLDQATKVNAWDRTLIVNGDKIAKLNESVTKVKADHTRLEHALDYLKTQQQEFETFLEPLEASLPVNIPVEPEREQLYSLTEGVDTQLQQMAEDLKEVIRHINESNKTVDKHDPISQILRILNEHTDALQWVEDSANQVRRSLEDVSKQHQMAKKDHERSLRQMFK